MYGSPQFQPPPRQPQQRRRRVTQIHATHQTRRHKLTYWELGTQISVNCLLAGVAIASIVQLLPAQINQQQKLATLQGEVDKAEERVDQLQAEFSRSFDAYGGQKLMQEYTLKVNPRQRRIIWVEPSALEGNSAPAQQNSN
ncbi:hypothetical protein NIES970_13950 [[Synechococcus] sp. NIES-970]|nr:hypothetical protein NIES970_13950 [[Synechococcus] sp. NIES-970]